MSGVSVRPGCDVPAGSTVVLVWCVCVSTRVNMPLVSEKSVTAGGRHMLVAPLFVHRPSLTCPETVWPQGWYPQRNRSGASCWGNHDNMKVSHQLLAQNHCCVCMSGLFRHVLPSDWSRGFYTSEEFKNVANNTLESVEFILSFCRQNEDQSRAFFSGLTLFCCFVLKFCSGMFPPQKKACLLRLDSVWYLAGTRSQCSPRQ